MLVKERRSVREKASRIPVAPRQQACVIFLNRSWPAVSQICIFSSLSPHCTTRDLKSTPIVAVQETTKRSSVNRVMRAVLPTPPSPITSTLASMSWPCLSFCPSSSEFFIDYILQALPTIRVHTSSHQPHQYEQQQEVAEQSCLLSATLLRTASFPHLLDVSNPLQGHLHCQIGRILLVPPSNQALAASGHIKQGLQLLQLLLAQTAVSQQKMGVCHTHLFQIHPLTSFKLSH